MALDSTGKTKPEETKAGGIAADRLRSLVERIERLEEERKALGNDIKDVLKKYGPLEVYDTNGKRIE